MSDHILSSFTQIGIYRGQQFLLEDSWRKRKGVYLWVRRTADGMIVLRVGIACGAGGFGGRFHLHNRWLAGRFKSDDLREQAIRHFTLVGLKDGDLVLAIEIGDRSQAIQFETKLRNHFGENLALDLTVPSSWAAQMMRNWRQGR